MSKRIKDLELTRTQIETLSLKITEKQTALRKEQNTHQETLEAHKKECQATRGVVILARVLRGQTGRYLR